MTQFEKGKRLAILQAARTPQAKAFSALATVSAVDLAKHASLAALERANLKPSDISEVVFGNVAGPADSANIARVIALKTGIPQDRIAHTVNRNCASGMEAIISAGHAIREGRSKYVLAGGTESMSNIPMLFRKSSQAKFLKAARAKTAWARLNSFAGFRLKDFRPVQGIALGLTDPSCGLNMGETAEILAKDFAISRSDQDTFAVESHRRAVEASDRCFMSGEIAPFDLPLEPGEALKLDVGPRAKQSMEQLAKLSPIFDKAGTVTAGNSCPLTDGAAAMVVSDERNATDNVLGYVSAYSIVGCDPKRMGLGPVFATARLLQETGLTLRDIDLLEINEAFASQVLSCLCAFNSTKFAEQQLSQSKAVGAIDPKKLNVNGGAIALGHPVGTSGARIVITLLRALRERRLERGIATLCVGGGQGVAMLVETH